MDQTRQRRKLRTRPCGERPGQAFLAVAYILGLCSCAAQPPPLEGPSPWPLGDGLLAYGAPKDSGDTYRPPEEAEELRGTLTCELSKSFGLFRLFN